MADLSRKKHAVKAVMADGSVRTVCGFDLQPTDEPQTFTNRDGRKYQMAKMKKTADCKVCRGVARASR